MPVSFIAGFFGMNFFRPIAPLDAWTGVVMFLAILILMVLTPAGMYLWMRKHGWM
jgi:magnesium transporter